MYTDRLSVFSLLHKGDPTEIRYILLGYGVPVDLLPVSHTGMVKTANHARWINVLREQENDLDDKEVVIVECPRSYDVVFRKGQFYKANPGNMHFRELIEQTEEEHSKAINKEKYQITWRIMKEIEDRNGRFLEWSNPRQTWIFLSDRGKIRSKVAACYKQYNRLMTKRGNGKRIPVHTKTLITKEKLQAREVNQNQQIRNIPPNRSSDNATVNGVVTNEVVSGDFLKDNIEVGRRKHDSSLQCTFNSKRRKTALFGGFSSNECTGSNDGSASCFGGDDSCFGKLFFRTS